MENKEPESGHNVTLNREQEGINNVKTNRDLESEENIELNKELESAEHIHLSAPLRWLLDINRDLDDEMLAFKKLYLKRFIASLDLEISSVRILTNLGEIIEIDNERMKRKKQIQEARIAINKLITDIEGGKHLSEETMGKKSEVWEFG